MTAYRNILVAVDGSDESDTILSKALKVANNNNAQLSVVLVFEPLLGHYSFELNMSDFEQVQQEHQSRVADEMQRRLSVQSPPIPAQNLHLRRGRPAAEIKKLTAELDIDLLIIGSHGHNPVRAVLGSTANAVLHGIECDVLTIRV